MSMATLERAVLWGAQTVFNNPKLKLKDIREWSTSEQTVKGNCGKDEVVARVPNPGVWVCIFKVNDKRK